MCSFPVLDFGLPTTVFSAMLYFLFFWPSDAFCQRHSSLYHLDVENRFYAHLTKRDDALTNPTQVPVTDHFFTEAVQRSYLPSSVWEDRVGDHVADY